ncbi:MAG: hypothetical protein QM676_07960 [Novosphingobium sp.]
MSFWSAMVAIVAILAFTAARIARYRAGLGDNSRHPSIHSAATDALSSPSPRENELQREVDDLRQRLAVLERIATEDRHSKSIAAEIESLRDR